MLNKKWIGFTLHASHKLWLANQNRWVQTKQWLKQIKKYNLMRYVISVRMSSWFQQLPTSRPWELYIQEGKLRTAIRGPLNIANSLQLAWLFDAGKPIYYKLYELVASYRICCNLGSLLNKAGWCIILWLRWMRLLIMSWLFCNVKEKTFDLPPYYKSYLSCH